MQPKGIFNSILVAIQYKNFFKNIHDDLQKDPILQNGNFSFLENLPLDYGIQAIRPPGKNNQPFANLFINPLRIQYEELEFPKEKIETIINLLKKANEKRNFLVPTTEADKIEFVGIIIQIQYDLSGEDIENLKKGVKEEEKEKIKTIEKKSNFCDKDDWNYNFSFNVDFDKKILVLRFDINDRFKLNKTLSNLNEIFKIIQEKIDFLSVKNLL